MCIAAIGRPQVQLLPLQGQPRRPSRAKIPKERRCRATPVGFQMRAPLQSSVRNIQKPSQTHPKTILKSFSCGQNHLSRCQSFKLSLLEIRDLPVRRKGGEAVEVGSADSSCVQVIVPVDGAKGLYICLMSRTSRTYHEDP